VPLAPKTGDTSIAAKLQKRYKKFVEESLYHTCGEWCSARGRCDKYFPVYNKYLICFITSKSTLLASLFGNHRCRRPRLSSPLPTPASCTNAGGICGKSGYIGATIGKEQEEQPSNCAPQ
jgi:hypothetical protein